ncbi:glyoxylase-like metal-dependent hydrolase (beta-lactamase superfamily II) [Micromonospora palomenae]|uniref:Glyoxylase-like metal-dependent hydrolase (Beta-lactamase superfamily II) n=1 Tax=Micromonospora palomenae TaxID=1461247 RepID=A0A561WGA4_9ACTN|nr:MULTISPECIES: MBL fold metallo-hydrolase [Micromonospora]MBQ0893915.1 MBL fold metallo-hydrolase [Micromonospora sp. U56]TWG22900.1 glyoxylase-like metal-dependent hydrolase (beta-lactamase superfamily II) [Micromonospora palomenae]
MGGHVTGPVAALADGLPGWVTLLRAPNPGPMTLDGTNTWVLRAAPGAPAVVVDPGPADEGHLGRIAAHGPVGSVLITHGHPDHTEGAARLADLLDGAAVRAADPAHTIGAAPLTPDAPVEAAGFTVRLVPTPGHTADSVCFLAEHGDERVVLTGDTILGRGTTVVAHPDGHLGDYLASLELLSAYRGIPALPGHGPALADCGAAAEFYLAHRRARLDQVRAAVEAGATTAPEVVARVYADVDRSLWWAAEWSVRAQLEYLGVAPRESGTGVTELEQP